MATAEEEQHNAAAYPRPAYAWYVVVLMMFFYVLSFMDRQIIAVLIDPIKADLSLSDVQISLIGGVSFGLFYSLVGIFIGRLADSMNRPLLIALGVFIWSLTTALSGLASKFWQLLVLRMGVGLGEAALLPSTLSLLTNYFPPKRLATPTSVFLLGAPIGIGLSFAAGGYLFDVAQDIVAADGWNDVIVIGGSAAWKLVLIFLGVVGMIMTFAMVTVREPRTTGAVAAAKPEEHALKASEAAKLSDVKIYARQHWLAIAGLYVCMALVSLAAYSQAFWDIAFLSRSYDRDPSSVTFMYGMVQMFAGLSGMLSGGILADRLTRRGVQGSSVIMVMIGCGIKRAMAHGFRHIRQQHGFCLRRIGHAENVSGSDARPGRRNLLFSLEFGRAADRTDAGCFADRLCFRGFGQGRLLAVRRRRHCKTAGLHCHAGGLQGLS
jgi:MFS family permease